MKKTFNIISKIFTIIIVIFALIMMCFTISSIYFNRTDKSIFTYKAFIVLSDSMSKTDFDAGDLILVKEVDTSTLKEGDIIAYTSQNIESYGEVITHKIRSITDDGFITYGTSTNTDDETIVKKEYVLGKYSFHIPKAGKFFMFLKTVPGYITCIFVPFLLLILNESVNCINLFKKYKRQEKDEIEKEKEDLRKEKEELLRLKQELLSKSDNA